MKGQGGRPLLGPLATALAVLSLAALCPRPANAQPTPEQLCAPYTGQQAARKALNSTAYVVCYWGAVWAVASCPTDPPGLVFNETTEGCVP